MSEKRNPLHMLLKLPFVYNLVQNGLATEHSRDFIYREFLDSKPGQKVLDLGCGPGKARAHLPDDVDYTGIDFNERHLETAQALYPNDRFLHGDLGTLEMEEQGQYDLVMMMGVLHHLDDEQADSVLADIPGLLKPTGRFCAVDPVFVKRGNPLAYVAARLDQGQNVRYAEGYSQLARPHFSQIESSVRSGLLKIPYTHHLLKCGLGDATKSA